MEQQTQVLRGFLAHVRSKEAKAEADGGFVGEFLKLKRQSTKYRAEKTYPTKAAERQENVKKNRYKDIVPFDHSRVRLSLSTSPSNNDYINANFIKGVFKEQAYIATQGPLAGTIVDFLRMIWEYNVEVIVMACREFEMGKKKCERYWPEKLGEVFVCDPFTVCCESEENKGDYVTRVLKVTYRDLTRKFWQLHYMNWPDHGVPDSIPPILEMIQEMRMYQDHENVPICIHCSAGCGRTGALCAIDYTWNLLKNELITEKFSIFHLVQDMRTQRPSVVQTKEQYELVYRAVTLLFERFLQTIDLNPRRTEIPAPSLPIQAESERDFSEELGIASELELEILLKMVEQDPKAVEWCKRGNWQFDQTHHVPELTESLKLSCPAVEEAPPSIHVSLPPKDPVKDLLALTTEPELSNHHSEEVVRRQKPQPVPRTSLMLKDKVGHKLQQVDQLPSREKEIEPDLILETPEESEGWWSSVEDPYFSSALEHKSPSESVDERFLSVQWTRSSYCEGPSLALNGQVLEPTHTGFLSTGMALASPDDDEPPPLPERTPESFILADKSDNQSSKLVSPLPNTCQPFLIRSVPEPDPDLGTAERETYPAEPEGRGRGLVVLYPPDTEDVFHGDGGPPSPVPPLPERTPESYILATGEDLVVNMIRDTPGASCARVGTSQEWCGSSELQAEKTKMWKRSKSLKVRMSFPAVPSFAPPPIPTPLEKTTFLPLPPVPSLPPPAPPPSDAGPPRSLTPPLPERTPESFLLAPQEDHLIEGPSHPPDRQHIGTSCEWAGNAQPKKHLDSVMNRSKSVRVRSSKQEPLLFACPSICSNAVLTPGGNIPVGSQAVDSGAAADTTVPGDRLNQSSEKTPLSNKPRTKSLKFLKNMRKPKENPPPSSAPSAPAPPYGITPIFRFGFGNRFRKPKGPRNQPENWV
ncbi:tyrosine-protein phosphatase non-receptor type 22 [Scleropages formosus]|uniref:tyrosine-protein phosphatase non-receptor type 22 n=1 Tax=Scleropages formosus TaxID=113540 RepID=UPI0008787F4C|nr:tyrosine-protein phosphatase non-receptor type 22-like [Scleropages formosus]